MKYLLFAIAMVIGSYCIGQKDSVVVKGDITGTTWTNGLTATLKQDTVKVLMLVCDTAMKNDFGKRLTVNQELFRLERRWSEGVWWQFGYEVYEMGYGSMPCNANVGTSAIAAVCYGWYRSKFINYLDQNKKPLPKSIVVWQTGEIKN